MRPLLKGTRSGKLPERVLSCQLVKAYAENLRNFHQRGNIGHASAAFPTIYCLQRTAELFRQLIGGNPALLADTMNLQLKDV